MHSIECPASSCFRKELFRREEVQNSNMVKLPWSSKVDEGDVDTLATLQLDAPRTGERSVTTRFCDVAGQVAEPLCHGHVSHAQAVWVGHCHHCNQRSHSPVVF